MANIGDILLEPEEGWKKLNVDLTGDVFSLNYPKTTNANSNYGYYTNISGCYMNDVFCLDFNSFDESKNISFSFYGKKLRVFGCYFLACM